VIAAVLVGVGWLILANKDSIAFHIFGCGDSVGIACFAPSQSGLLLTQLCGMALILGGIIAGIVRTRKLSSHE
jgi:hypothetical protein